MPILNKEILIEIFIESIDLYDEDSVIKFMLAGKQTFKIAENHFQQITELQIYDKWLAANIKYSPQKIKPCWLNYNFPFLKYIFPINNLIIRLWPDDKNIEEYLEKILIQENFESLSFNEYSNFYDKKNIQSLNGGVAD